MRLALRTERAKGIATTFVAFASLCAASLVGAGLAQAAPRDQAFRIHSRIAGVPPTAAVLDQMEALVKAGKVEDAAKVAMDNPNFYNLTLKNWVTPWTAKDQSVRGGLNDYSATVIGMIRDDVSFDQVLSADIVYTGAATLTGVPAYSLANNTHYDTLEAQNIDLKANLVQQKQSTLSQLGEQAGVLSTRGFAAAYYFDGTNRAAIRATMATFTCNELEQLSDTTVPDFRVRRDVDRAPGGDAAVFRNKCAGCHAGMDALDGAFAHYDFVNATLTYDKTKVADKMNKNPNTFADGFVVSDDGWINMWANGQNARLGWNGDQGGTGATAFGKMLASTDEFPVCMAKRVKNAVCLTAVKDISSDDVADEAAKFKADNFNMKNMFARTAATCMGD